MIPREEDVRRALLADPYQPGSDAVHNVFGLSYANYLVLPRAILQCMSNEWQLRFVACIDELHARFDSDGNYRVQLLDHDDHGEDDDTPTPDRARIVPDPLSNYRHPNWAELARRRKVSDET